MKIWHFGLCAACALALVLGVGARSGKTKQAARPPVQAVHSDLPQSLAKTLFSYDRNGDGRITPEELPQAMRPLVEMGDAGRDGALEADEIAQLADRVCQDVAHGLLPSARAALSAPNVPASVRSPHVRFI